MNNEKYHLILTYYPVLSGKHLIGNKFIFQHDNDPKESWTGLPRAQTLRLLKQRGIFTENKLELTAQVEL